LHAGQENGGAAPPHPTMIQKHLRSDQHRVGSEAMKSLFDPVVCKEIVQRVGSLQPDVTREWGKMSVSQMMEHSARGLEMACGLRKRDQVFLGRMIGWIFRKHFVGEKPFSKNGPTGPDFIVTDEPAFDAARERLLNLIHRFHALGEKGCNGNIHGFFGRMTGAEWGVTQYKHLDHHLRQFHS
jgi:Protein of unknown function (DUF1569)